jgi:hypothetical protein
MVMGCGKLHFWFRYNKNSLFVCIIYQYQLYRILLVLPDLFRIRLRFYNLNYKLHTLKN